MGYARIILHEVISSSIAQTKAGNRGPAHTDGQLWRPLYCSHRLLQSTLCVDMHSPRT